MQKFVLLSPGNCFVSGFSKEAGENIFTYRSKWQSYNVITKANGRHYNMYQISNKRNIMEKNFERKFERREEKGLYILAAKYE